MIVVKTGWVQLDNTGDGAPWVCDGDYELSGGPLCDGKKVKTVKAEQYSPINIVM